MPGHTNWVIDGLLTPTPAYWKEFKCVRVSECSFARAEKLSMVDLDLLFYSGIQTIWDVGSKSCQRHCILINFIYFKLILRIKPPELIKHLPIIIFIAIILVNYLNCFSYLCYRTKCKYTGNCVLSKLLLFIIARLNKIYNIKSKSLKPFSFNNSS